MKTTRKALPLICLMMTVMLLMASCDLSFIPGLNSTTSTTPEETTFDNSPQETPIDISKIPESKGLSYQAIDDTTCAVFGIGTCRDTVVRIPEVIDGYRVTDLAWAGEGDSLEEMLEQIDGVTTIIIPKTVTEIISEAFLCGNLNAIVVDPANPIYYSEGNCVIEKISKTLVLGCNGSVIPKDVTRIGEFAFWYCPALTNITFEGTKAAWSSLAFNPAGLYIGEFYTIHCTDGDIVIEGGDSTCEHSFRSDCDEYCKNGCGFRKAAVDHTYSSDCDEYCDVCDEGYRKAAVDHTYSSDCDEYCDVCGGYRGHNSNHQPDHDSMYPDGIKCLICGGEVLVTSPGWESCSSCGHHPDKSCDKICDNCGAELPHSYHDYPFADDPSCYFCGEIRSLN